MSIGLCPFLYKKNYFCTKITFLQHKPLDKHLLLNIIVIYEHLFVFVCTKYYYLLPDKLCHIKKIFHDFFKIFSARLNLR